MLQISKSYTFKQLCHKSDGLLRKYLAQQNIDINEEERKLENVLNEADNSEYISESLPDDLPFEAGELALVTESEPLLTESEPVYGCDECPATFDLRVDLEVHKIEHENEKKEREKLSYEAVDKYICNVCEKQFKGKH